jgi:adenylate cyclase class IV
MMMRQGIAVQQKFSLFLWICATTVDKSSQAAAFSQGIHPSDFRRSFTTTQQQQQQMLSSLEVEQKFQVIDYDSSGLEPKLRDLGFVPKGTVTFVDWYFDRDDNYLTTRDVWFRFRENKGLKGVWQLKRGRGQNTDSTVYEETEGEEAISIVLSLTPKNITQQKISFRSEDLDGFHAPKLPLEASHGLFPFCRLETTRSSWVIDMKNTASVYNGLVVDLDSTNTGHTVGEVETVVNTDEEIPKAKERVEALIAKLTQNNAGSQQGPATGKLEHFLINNRPEHYDACVKSGVIKDKGKN